MSAAGDFRMCAGDGLRQEAPQTMAAMHLGPGADSSARGVRGRRATASTDADVHGHGHSDFGRSPALDEHKRDGQLKAKDCDTMTRPVTDVLESRK